MTVQIDPENQPLLSPTSPPTSYDSSSSTSSSPSSYPFPGPRRASNGNDTALLAPSSLAPEPDLLPTSSPLGRTLSWQSVYFLVTSRVIGSGIFATPGSILRSVGSPGLSLLLWAVGSVIAACALAVSLEFGSMLPRSGGDKVYLEFTYRRPRFLASTMVAVYAVLLGFTASNCVVFSQYVLFALGYKSDDGSGGGDAGEGEEASDVLQKTLAVGLLSSVVLVHGVFPRTGVRVQNWLGWLKVGIVLFMILSALYVVLVKPPGYTPLGPAGGGAGAPDGSTAPAVPTGISWDTLWRDSVWNWGNVATALFKVFYSYAGLDNANLVMSEVKNPVRTLRSVAFTALVTSCALYLLVNVAYFMVVPVEEIKESGELIAGLFFKRLFGERVGQKILPLAVAVSAAGNVLVVAFAQARLKQEIARQGFLPFSEILSSTKPFNSPLGGLTVHFIPSFLVIVLPPSREVYSFILEVEGYPGQFFALAVSFGLVWLRFKRPDLRRPFKAWLPAVYLRILLSLALLTAPFFPPPDRPEGGLFYATYAIVGVAILLIAFTYWAVWTRLVPRWRRYRLEEKADILDDGTTITKLMRVPY